MEWDNEDGPDYTDHEHADSSRTAGNSMRSKYGPSQSPLFKPMMPCINGCEPWR